MTSYNPNRPEASAELSPFFSYFSEQDRAKLGNTSLLVPKASVAGARGEFQKLFLTSVPDAYASPVTISIRSEYTLTQNTFSPQPGATLTVTDATNAAPIVITTTQQHQLQTGAQVTINGVTGNLGANGAFAITVTGPTTFSLNGSAGTGAFTGGGVVVVVANPNPTTNAPLFGNPLVARIRWGTGGAYNQIDFDVPPPGEQFALPITPESANPEDDRGNGVTITLSGSSFEVLVRNDSNLSLLTALGASTIGQPAADCKVQGSINPAQGPGVGKLTRTIYVAGDSGAPFGPHFPLAPGAVSPVIFVPPFSKRVWFPRSPSNRTPLSISRFKNTSQLQSDAAVDVNSDGPIELQPNDAGISITNNGAVNCDFLQAGFQPNPP